MRLFLKLDKGGWLEPFIDDKSGDVALNYTYDNLVNPSEYVSEYTFSIKVKRSPENERLFEHVTRLDSTSAGFNPAIRYEYVIISDFTDIISRGSCFVDVVDDNELKLSMLGSLNYVFSKLINSGWDTVTASEDSEYHLLPDYTKFNGATYTYDMYLTKRLVWNSWMIDNPVYSLSYLKQNVASLPSIYELSGNTNWRHCFVASIIGFAPTNCGYYDGFSPDKWYYPGPKLEHLLLPVLAEDNQTNYDVKVTDRQQCEYRSYYQKPFIYTNKLFQIFEENFSAITDGWTLNLDSRWFSDGNPMYHRSIYVLPNVFNGDEDKFDITGATTYDDITIQLPALGSGATGFASTGYVGNLENATHTFVLPNVTVHGSGTVGCTFESTIFAHIPFPIEVVPLAGPAPYQTYTMYANFAKQALLVTFRTISSINSVLATKTYAVVPLPNTKNSSGDYIFNISDSFVEELQSYQYEVITYRYTPTTGENYIFPLGEFQATGYYTNQIVGDLSVHFEIELSFYNTTLAENCPFMIEIANEATYAYSYSGTPDLRFAAMFKYGTVDTKRSGSLLTMERLFNGTNPFSVLLKFTKMNNLIWVTDEQNKTVTVIHRYDYFLDCMTTDMNSGIPLNSEFSYRGLLDITPYVHVGKNYEIKQPSWDTNRVTFNFGDGEEDYADGYEEKYGRTFGSKVIVTENRKNSDNKDLFCNSEYDTILPPVCSTQIIQPVKYIKTGTNIKKETEPFISNVSGEGNADVTDRFFLRLENGEWLEEINSGFRNGYVRISDDMVDEYYNNEFAYHGGAFATSDYKCTERPQIMMSVGNRGVIFGMPREVYAGIGSEQRVQTLYEAWWQKYIENIYSGDNKRFTCYVRMSSAMYKRLKMNPLVQFENCAYLVAKIDGWNEKNEITKVTLVQIGDLNELTNNQLEDYDDRFWLWDDEDGLDFDDDAKAVL